MVEVDGKMIGDRLQSGKGKIFVDETREDINDLVKVLMHRVQYGSPPIMAASDEVAFNDQVVMQQKQKRIQRRRALLGLPYEPWTGF